jgi:hypothetical protein
MNARNEAKKRSEYNVMAAHIPRALSALKVLYMNSTLFEAGLDN